MEAAVFRGTRNACEIEVLDAGGVRRAKHGTDVMNGAHIVHHHGDRVPGQRADSLWVGAGDFFVAKLAHGLCVKVRIDR